MKTLSIWLRNLVLIAAGSASLFAQNPAASAAAVEGANTGPNSPASGPIEITDSDPNILYIGRWDRTQPGVAHGNWTGHYLRTQFTGTSVSVRLKAGTQLAVSIDGEPVRFVSAKAGVTRLHDQPLKAGGHLLQLGSGGQNYEVAFQGLVLDPGAATKPVEPKPIIEFIGDSITTMFVGNNFAWLAAGMLDCDLTQISFSGVSLTSGYGCLADKVGQDEQYFRLKNFNHLKDDPKPAWDFSYTPTMVVILLGQNDQCGSTPPAVFTETYIRFVRKIQEKFPAAKFVMMRTFGGPYEKEIAAAAATLRQGGAKVLYVDTTGWLAQKDFSDGIHPNAGGHLKAARKLANILAPAFPGN
ncbi:MAG: GDSL-type esterase/lipase family protein [Verrucomicrobia bacterium]|nr:GDSL-type esterase/lipase family protein [Verrucomicrobiota bacterium]